MSSITPVSSPLYIVTAISNPVRFQSRYRLYHDFAKRVKDAGATLVTVELAFGDRPFAITDRGNPYHLQLRTTYELWHKENLLNLGINRLSQLHPDWEYVAWIDADVEFARADWVHETIQQLQHHQVVQMFSHALDLGPNYEPLLTHKGFCYTYLNYPNFKDKNDDYCLEGHPGYAWAARREAIDNLGGLLDVAILGAADKHMALALLGYVDRSISDKAKAHHKHKPLSVPYMEEIQRWEKRALKHIRKNIGYVAGTLMHYWHGRKAKRGYIERWKILVDHEFNPHIDLKRDSQGLYQLVDTGDERSLKLRDGIRKYFRSRDEDSTQMD
jgi:hypothetical protein